VSERRWDAPPPTRQEVQAGRHAPTIIPCHESLPQSHLLAKCLNELQKFTSLGFLLPGLKSSLSPSLTAGISFVCGNSSNLKTILRIFGTDSPSISGMDDIAERTERRMIIIATFG